MRLGVPFIAPRQLGAVESIPGRLILPSVDWRTGQSGARFLSLTGAADRWQPESRWRTGHVRCTPYSPVPPSSRWLGHVSRADRAADRWPGRPLAHRTVRCTPDSPVNFSRTPPANFPRAASSSRASLAHRTLSGAHRTVRCTTGQSGAPDRNSLLAVHSQVFSSLLLSVSNT